MATSDDREPVRTVTPSEVLRALVYVPIGIGATVVTEAPRRLAQARNDLRAARFLGEMAVTQGVAQLRERQAATPPASRATATAPSRRPAAPTPPADDRNDEPDPASSDTAGSDEPGPIDAPTPADAVSGIAAAELPIPDYDTVPAIDVVTQLGDLEPAERDLVAAYERANRSRRTILGKIAQLEGAT